jgi:hypothetical protein
MPHIAHLGRTKPLRDVDRAQLDQTCMRITNGQEFLYGVERIDGDWRYVVRFSEPHHAEALRDWVRREHFSERPPPKFGPTDEEKRAFEEVAIAWGARTGALRRVVQAYRRAMFENETMMRCDTAAQQALRAYLPPEHGFHNMARVMVSWAMQRHWHWFFGERPWAANPFRPADWYPPDDAYPHSDE